MYKIINRTILIIDLNSKHSLKEIEMSSEKKNDIWCNIDAFAFHTLDNLDNLATSDITFDTL